MVPPTAFAYLRSVIRGVGGGVQAVSSKISSFFLRSVPSAKRFPGKFNFIVDPFVCVDGINIENSRGRDPPNRLASCLDQDSQKRSTRLRRQ